MRRRAIEVAHRRKPAWISINPIVQGSLALLPEIEIDDDALDHRTTKRDRLGTVGGNITTKTIQMRSLQIRLVKRAE
jgi:hypothetical protein